MGKKSKKSKPKNAPASPGKGGVASARHAAAKSYQEKSNAESFQRMAEMDRLTLQQQKGTIRKVLIDIGTDVSQYARDPTGDGDQTLIKTTEGGDAARELYSIGGDIHAHLTHEAISDFALTCAMGAAGAAEMAIERVAKLESKPYSRSKAMLNLLETRETSLRLSPLLLIVSAGKNLRASHLPGAEDHVETAKILLKYGASPVAKDVLGKTVCHYGAGMMATNMTLEVVDLCIQAAQTHHLYGQEVQLHGLDTQSMIDKVGVAGGFDCSTGRRSVYLQEEDREVWIKTENMKLCSPSGKGDPIPLTDIQDRCGSVSLHEVMMTDRVDVAEFLLQKHSTSIQTTDIDGMSPVKMASGMGQLMSPPARLVMDQAVLDARETTRARKDAKNAARKHCGNCRKELDRTKEYQCSRCHSIWYCGRDCQVSHWKAHKKECKEKAELLSGVKLGPPSSMIRQDGLHHASFSLSTGRTYASGSYQKPHGAGYDQKFVVKVQAAGDRIPIMIYDETRECQFDLHQGQPGFNEILAETRKEPAWGGRKTFMKASFDRGGVCTVYPGSAGAKARYTW